MATDRLESQAFQQACDFEGSMNERLALFVESVRRIRPASKPWSIGWSRACTNTKPARDAPKPGDEMPLFVLPDENGRMVSLTDLLAQGPAVVTFHRGHWCPYCRISINTLARGATAHPGARRADGGDRAGSPAVRGRDAARTLNVNFPILTDMDNGYAMSLNLAIWVGAEMEDYMTVIGRILPHYQGNDSWMLPIPATFVVGRDGRIRACFVDPDYRKRMAIEELDRGVAITTRFHPVLAGHFGCAQHFHEGRGDRGALATRTP